MIWELVSFLTVGSVVGLTTILLAEPQERPIWKEYLSFAGVVLGGIALFTMFVVAVSALFQY